MLYLTAPVCNDWTVLPRRNQGLRHRRSLWQALRINHLIIGKIKADKLKLFFEVQLH